MSLSLEEACRIQSVLSKAVEFRDDFWEPRYVAGADVAYADDKAVGAAVVVEYETLKVVEEIVVEGRCDFPYVPTFLAFREGPTLIKVLDELKVDPEICLLDGHGIAHPLRCGLATHVGILMKKATVGVAKGHLHGEIGKFVGKWAPLKDGEEVIGAVLRRSPEGKSLFISVGNLVTLKRAMIIVERCMRDGNPVPLRLAHIRATREVRCRS